MRNVNPQGSTTLPRKEAHLRTFTMITIDKSYNTYTFNNNYNNTQRTVLLLGNNKYLQITGWTLGTQPSFCIVHPLATRSNGETIYGVSIYVQMTDKELKAMQNSAE